MKYKILSSFILVLLLIASCDKYLETKSPSTFSADYIFSNETDMFKAVAGAYDLLTVDEGYGTRLSFYNPMNTDVDLINVGTSSGGRYGIASFLVGTSDSEIKNPWNNCYKLIDRTNQCIEGIKKSEIFSTSALAKQMYGEVVALRAQMYYELVRNWGDVPFKTTPTRAGEDFNLPRTDRDSILSFLVNDLISVEPTMMWSWDSKLGSIERINREFVQGLIARISLFRGGYSLRPDMTMKRNESDYLNFYRIANKYCKIMMDSGQHSLVTPFKQVFYNECQLIVPQKDDVLYEIAFGNTKSGEVGYFNGIVMSAGTHPYGSASGSVGFPPSYYYSFDTADTRLPVTCALYSLDKDLKQTLRSVTTISSGKWCKAWMPSSSLPGSSSTKGTGINWPIMRYADVILMYAETENEINGGPTQAAKDALKAVRKRAFPASVWDSKVDAYIENVSASRESFFNAIVDERAWEFGGECIRKYDLVRWNLYGKKIVETRSKTLQMAKDALTNTGTYADFPSEVYWRNNGLNLEILGAYRKYKSVVDLTVYTKQTWLNVFNDPKTTYLSENWKGYIDETGNAPVRYILPINQDQINSSGGLLQNYYGY